MLHERAMSAAWLCEKSVHAATFAVRGQCSSAQVRQDNVRGKKVADPRVIKLCSSMPGQVSVVMMNEQDSRDFLQLSPWKVVPCSVLASGQDFELEQLWLSQRAEPFWCSAML